MDTGVCLTILDGAMDGGYNNIQSPGEPDSIEPVQQSPGEMVHQTPEPLGDQQQPAVYEALQIETTESTDSSMQNKTRSNRMIIVMLVITVIVLCSAVAGGLGWYFGSQNINPGRGKVLISRF